MPITAPNIGRYGALYSRRFKSGSSTGHGIFFYTTPTIHMIDYLFTQSQPSVLLYLKRF